MKTMRNALSWLAALALAGCAQAPLERHAPYTVETGRTPYSAAICIARNARSMSGMSAEERIQGDAAWEVVVRESRRSAHVAVADIQPRGAGSVVAIRVAEPPREGAAAFAQRLLSDCQAQAVR
jgi:hypothetical protein